MQVYPLIVSSHLLFFFSGSSRQQKQKNHRHYFLSSFPFGRMAQTESEIKTRLHARDLLFFFLSACARVGSSSILSPFAFWLRIFFFFSLFEGTVAFQVLLLFLRNQAPYRETINFPPYPNGLRNLICTIDRLFRFDFFMPLFFVEIARSDCGFKVRNFLSSSPAYARFSMRTLLRAISARTKKKKG